MNQELQRTYAVKLFGVSLVAAVVWYTAVKPKVELVRELEEFHAIQVDEIQQGEESISQQSTMVHSSINKMSLIRDELISQFDVEDTSNVHKHLQESAEAHGLTVSRIEPLRNSESKLVSEVDQGVIKIATKEFRVECVGSYGEIVEYLDDLTNGMNIAKVGSFRINPVSSEYAHLVLQVSVYQLTEIPTTFIESFNQSETIDKDAGDSDDEA